MFDYKIHYLEDMDDLNWKTHTSQKELNVGDVIQLASDLYHVVVDIHQQATQTRIDVSQSAQTESEARLIAQQQGLLET